MRKQAVASLVIVLMILSSLGSIFVSGISAASDTSPTSLNTTNIPFSSATGSFGSTYGIGLSGAPAEMDANTLAQLGGNPYSKANMELNITRYFVPLGIHLVFLDPFWDSRANTSTTMIGQSTQISDWLSLGVKYQISTIFFFKQFGYYFASPSWDDDFLSASPSAATANFNGSYAPLFGGATMQAQTANSTSSGNSIVATLSVRNGYPIFVVGGSSTTTSTVSEVSIVSGATGTFSKMKSSDVNHDLEIWSVGSVTCSESSSCSVKVKASFTATASLTMFAFVMSGWGGSFSGVKSSSGSGTGSKASVASFTPDVGSGVISFALSSGTGNCVPTNQFTQTIPNNEAGGGIGLCGEYMPNWGYGSAQQNYLSGTATGPTTTPVAVPMGSWDEVSISIDTPGCTGCTSSSGWTIADEHDLYNQLQEDLLQLNKWYGNYSSWIGIGEGATGDRNQYANSGTSLKGSRPWDNGTIYEFAHSFYFQRNINTATGYYLNDPTVLSKVWSEFLSEAPLSSYMVGYGTAGTPSGSVYSSSVWTSTFRVPVGAFYKGFTFKDYFKRSGGTTSSITETLLSNYTGGNHFTALESHVIPASSVGTSLSWTSQTFSTTLVPSMYYEVQFSSSAPSSSAYTVYDATWVQSSAGANVTINPYYVEDNSNYPAIGGTYFEVPNTMTVNQVEWEPSDRAYDPYSISFGLVNTVTGDKLASGTITFAEHGYPTQLTKTVVLQPGVKYAFNFSSLPSQDYYGVVEAFLSSDVSPPYVGQSKVPTFILGYGDYEAPQQQASNHAFFSETDLQASPGYVQHGNATQLAIRFTAPGTGSLESFEVEAISTTNSASASLTASLYTDNPTTHVPGALVSSGSVSLAAIYAGFRSNSACFGGQCSWANVTFSGGSLTGGNYYWIVLSSPTYEVELERLVNPHNFLVYQSYNNGKTWGTPLDGPTEVAFQIKTSAGDINNTAIGQYEFEFGSGIAQSFEPTSSFQLVGVSFQTLTNGGSEEAFTGYIESDSGSDSPSGRVLATFYSYPTFGQNLGGSANFGVSDGAAMQLNHPVNLTAGSKYWMVIPPPTCLAGFQCSSPPRIWIDIYRSDASSALGITFNGLHYEVQSGSSWLNQPYGLGNIGFYLEGSNMTMKTYSTRQLYNEINTYDSQSTGSPTGWNSFLMHYETTLMYNLTLAMTGLTGRQFYWYSGVTQAWGNMKPNYNYVLTANAVGPNPIGCDVTNPTCGGEHGYYASVLYNYLMSLGSASESQSNSLLWSSLGSKLDNAGTVSVNDLRLKYLVALPPEAHQILSFDDWVNSVYSDGILNLTEQTYPRAFGQLLSRMAFTGGWFGTTIDAVKALYVTSPSDDGDFPMWLEPAVQVTTTSDFNLTGVNLNNYNVVIIGGGGLTPNALSRVQSFVSGGGGYVQTAFAGGSGESSALLGLQTSSVISAPTSTLTIVKANKITSPYTSISYTAYWQKYQVSNYSGDSATVLVRDSNNNPVITSNIYGSGIAVLLQQPTGISPNEARLSSLLESDSYVTLLINAVYYAAHESNMLPIFWDTSYGSGSQANAALRYFSVDGSSGTPLFWASNNSSQKESFDVHLNATFYGVTGQWVALDVQNMSVVASGTTSDIHLRVVMQPWSWAPIYILSVPTNLAPLYSTATIAGVSVSSSGVQYNTTASTGTSGWLIIHTDSPPSSVASSTYGGLLPTYPSLPSLNASQIGSICTDTRTNGQCSSFRTLDQEGWYYDQENSLLYVHFQQGIPVTVTVNIPGSITTTTSTGPPRSTSETSLSTSYSSTSSGTARTVTSSTWTRSSTPHTATGSSSSLTTSTSPEGTATYALTVTGGCAPDGGGEYPAGAIATISTNGVCNRSDGSGLRVTGWSLDGDPPVSLEGLQTLYFQVKMSGPHSVVILTATQYQLTIDFAAQQNLVSLTPPSIPGDGYWYDNGTEVSYTGLTTSRGINVTGWSWDGSAFTNVTNSASFTTSPVVMNSPHSLFLATLSTAEGCSAGACQDFQGYSTVVIQSDAPRPVSVDVDGSWFSTPAVFTWPSGSLHNVTLGAATYDSATSRTSFIGWSGSINSSGRSQVFEARSEMNLRLDFRNQYLVGISFIDENGRTVLPKGVLVVGQSGTFNITSSQLWLDSGKYQVIRATWMDVDMTSLPSGGGFSVGAPGKILVELPIYEEVVTVKDLYGLPIAGAVVTLSVGNISQRMETNSSGIALFEQVPPGPVNGTVRYLSVTTSLGSLTEGGNIINVTMVASYPVFATIFAVLGAAGFAVVRKVHRRPGLF